MASVRRRFVATSLLLCAGCISAPVFELPGDEAEDPFATDGPYALTTTGPQPDAQGEGSGEGTGGMTGGLEGGSSGDGASSGPLDPTLGTTGGDDTTGPWTDGSTGGEESTGGHEEVTTGGTREPGFPPASPFGDEASEVGLVGSWTVAWNPDGTPHWNLSIAGDGAFTWTEAAASCGDTALAEGVLWVEGEQLVMHVEQWDKRDPWPVESVVGEPLQLPFRLHLDYAMALGMLSISGPWELTAMLGWEGRVYRRDPGVGPAGLWTSSASLEAILSDGAGPRVIVVDSYSMETAGGAQAFETTQRTWMHGDAPLQQPPVVETFPWWNLSPGQTQGIIAIGGLQHLFDAERLVAFDESRVFSEEAPQGCD